SWAAACPTATGSDHPRFPRRPWHTTVERSRWVEAGRGNVGHPVTVRDADFRTGVASMLSDEEIEAVAQDYVRRAYAADREIFHRENRSEPDGIFFVAKGSLPGDGGFFVTRASGEIWHFGSGQFGLHGGLENLLKWYAEGWRPGGYRLTVREVNDPVQ